MRCLKCGCPFTGQISICPDCGEDPHIPKSTYTKEEMKGWKEISRHDKVHPKKFSKGLAIR